MLGGLLVLVLTGILAFAVVNRLKRKYPFIDAVLLKWLFFYHALLSFVYYLYVLFNPSDSRAYFKSVLDREAWFSLFGTSTTFIKFLIFPFVKYLGFSYEAAMALFAFFGYLGFVYAYIFFKENLKFKHEFFGYDLLTLLFFLPNLHFWSGSIGKGSVIFLGIGLFFFGINNVKSRWLAILIGGFVIYHVRPHIMLVILISSAIGFIFSTRGISIAFKIIFLAGATVAFFYIYKDVLTMVGIDEEEFLTQGMDLTHRARELTKATSGVDITNYSLPMQVFTFLYRPLFFDAPGILGLIVSIENVFYLLLTLKILSLKGLRFLITGGFIVKSAFISFITVTIALAQIAGNLGLAMRQKSQVMILFLFVIIMFLDEQKFKKWKVMRQQQARRERMKRLVTRAPVTSDRWWF
jgi:hypothetical protein